ncbi:hypothetical protein PHISP_06646 [Aspergillus sp. HF37]|nr:hypothetical protein PHISP_06646 [Aspergillus sp. HF37]
MMALQQSFAAGQDSLDNELNTEINDARNRDYLRGVKRLCAGLHDGVGQEGGHSFIETKWELEISRKRRKPPAGYRAAQLSDQPSATLSAHETKDATATPAAVRGLTPQQESKLVRSALRSSLDGEDTAVLNNFLSKAQAKRAAKATAAQDAEEKASREVSCHTPPRKALDDLDANSPSPVKAQLSPCKTGRPENSPDSRELASKDGEKDHEQQPASPVTRRSTRARQPPNPPPRATPPAVRNTLLRRAKGTEFIFRERTEEQEVEIKTRANTLQNKGEAVLPKAALKAMTKQPPAESLVPDKGALESRDEALEGENTRKSARKQVSWRKLRFVEYEGGVYDDYFSESSGDDIPAEQTTAKRSRKDEPAGKTEISSARSARQGSKKNGKKDASEAPGATPAASSGTKARRVRRLGPRTVNIPADTSDAPTDTPSADDRKKLTPSSPSAALLVAPASKKVTATRSSSNSNGQSKRKKILTANAGSTPKPKRVRSKS